MSIFFPCPAELVRCIQFFVFLKGIASFRAVSKSHPNRLLKNPNNRSRFKIENMSTSKGRKK